MRQSQTADNAETAVETVETVKMYRNEGPPHEADIHPAEVENYTRGGWSLIKPKDRS